MVGVTTQYPLVRVGMINKFRPLLPVLLFGSKSHASQVVKPDDDIFSALDTVFGTTQYLAKLDKHGIIKESPDIRTAECWQELPDYLKQLVQHFIIPEAPVVLKETVGSGKLGILEEASDIWHEALGLAAIQEGLIDEPHLSLNLQHIREKTALKRRKNLKSGMEFAESLIPPVCASVLSQWAGIDEAKARSFLALVSMKFATLRYENKAQDLADYTRNQMNKEYFELLEKLPQDKQHLEVRLSKLKRLFTQGSLQPHLPEIRETLVGILKETLGPQSDVNLMVNFNRKKHQLRQGLRFDRMEDPRMDYDKRKWVLKPYEALIEAFMIKRYANGFQVFG